MAGTFSIIPDSVSVSTGLFTEWTAFQVGGADLLAGLLSAAGSLSGGVYPWVMQGVNAPPAPFTVDNVVDNIRLGFSLISNIISLDGAPAISFAGLPAGFTIDSATISIYTENNASDGTNHFKLRFADNSGEQSGDLGFGVRTFFRVNDHPTTLSWWSNGIGIIVDNTVIGQRTSRMIARLAVTGVYHIAYTIISILPNPAKEGDVVTITGTDLQNIPLIPDPTIQYTDDAGNTQTVTITNATLVDNQHITFTVPPATGAAGADPPFYDGNGTMFSGTVPLGTITFYNAHGSGIYKFVANQRHDILYDRSNASTTNVAIPTPFGETGFIGG